MDRFSAVLILTSVAITRAQTSQPIDVNGASALDNVPDYFRRMYEAIAQKSNAEKTVDERPMLPAIVRGFVGSAMSKENSFVFNLTGAPRYSIVWTTKVLVWKYPKKTNTGNDVSGNVWVSLYDYGSRRMIGRARTSVRDEGYVAFEVQGNHTQDWWLETASSNLGLYIEAESRTSDLGFVLDGNKNRRKGPILVEYADDKNALRRFLHSFVFKEPVVGHSEHRANHSIQRRAASGTSTGGCSMRDMIVNFKKMGSKNVVGPPEYNAKRCVGQCTFPLTHADNPSKYANVQATLHNIDSTQGAGLPCCVPTRLGSASLLLQLAPNQYDVRTFDEMVVTSCGCR